MWIELAEAARKIVTELVSIKESENVLIIADSASDRMAVDATAGAVYSVGATPVVVWYPTPPDVMIEPPKPVAEAIKNADAVIEFAEMFLLYTKAYEEALKAGCRWECLTAVNAKQLVDVIGKADNQTLSLMEAKFRKLLDDTAGKKVRIVSPAGSDVTFTYQLGIRPRDIPVKPGEHRVIPGQTGWAPVLESTNGIVVFDGSMWPPVDLGILTNPIKFTVKDGKIVKIEGGREARVLQKWLDDVGDEEMYYPAHFLPGFHPQCKPCGFPVVDERVYGCCTMGIGWYHNGRPGHRPRSKKHADGEMMDISMWIDGQLIEKEGRFVHPELKKIEEKLLAPVH